MAIPAIAKGASVVVSGLSELGSAGSAPSADTMRGGIGAKILGAPGDPAGTIYDLIQNRKNRKEREKMMALQLDKWNMEKKMLEQEYNKNEMDKNWTFNFRNAMVG